MEDAFVHLRPGYGIGALMGRQVVQVLVGLPVLPHHDGAATAKACHLIHCIGIKCGKYL